MPKPNANTNETIDDRILSRIPGLSDDTSSDDGNYDDVAQDDPDDRGGQGGEEAEQTQAQEGDQDDEGFRTVQFRARDSKTGKDQLTQGPDNRGQQKKTVPIDPKTGKPIDARQQQQQFADPLAHQGAWKTDAKGNVINKDGAILARAGNERRLFEKARVADQRAQSVARELEANKTTIKKLTDQLADNKVLGGQPAALGLSAEESYMGLRLVSMYKSDPGQFFRYVVDQLTKAGHDVSKLGAAAGAAATPSVEAFTQLIKTTLQQELGPLKETRARAEEEGRANEDAAREAEEFFNRYPDAQIHEDVLARLLDADASLSPDAAYWRLKAFAAEASFDFSQPLQPQMEARKANGNRSQQRQQNGNGRPSGNGRPMPTGRAANGSVTERKPQVASPDEPWDNIIRQSMADSGMARQ